MLDDIIELHRTGHLIEAEAGYRELLATDPDDAEVLHLLGILRGQSGDTQEGLALVLRAIERDDQRDVFQHTLGEMQLHAGNLDAARVAYLRAKELNPNLTSAHSGLGQIAFLRGDLDTAEQHFRIALRADEDDAQSLAALGNIHFSRGDLRKASSHLSRAAELNPNDPLIQGSLANAMLALDTPAFAVQAANNALALKPDYAFARIVLGNAQLAMLEPDAAIAAFEALVARGELLATAHQGMGDAARQQQRYADAIRHYEDALRHDETLHTAALRRADALARGGRVEEAMADLRTRIRTYPRVPTLRAALAHLLGQRHRYPESLAMWREAAALLPGNPQIEANLALALDRAGEYKAAAEQAQRVGGTPRPALVLVRARAALSANDAAGALQILQSLEELRWENRPELSRRRQKLLGLAHDALGEWLQAVQAFTNMWRGAASTLPQLPELDEALRATLRERAGEPPLRESSFAAPTLLIGLPGSGVGRVAALLGDQPALAVRRDRFTASADFVSAKFDERLLQSLSQSDLAFLERRYARPVERGKLREGARLVDWLPWLDARVLPALKRALPRSRIVIVRRDPRDALLNWLAFGASPQLVMHDPVEAARWLRTALAHQHIAPELLPAQIVDADALLADPAGEQGVALAAFLGLEHLIPGPLAQAAAKGRGGLPREFASGHAAHYREALAEAFALLD